MRQVIGAFGLIVLLSACAAPPVAQQSPGPSSVPAASPSPAASPQPPAGFTKDNASGGTVSESTVTTVRVGQHEGYDRFVIEFGGGIPTYTVTRQAAATFTRSPKGDQVTLDGNAGVLIVVHSITNWTNYTGPTAINAAYPCLKQAQQVENFEGYQQWALGVQGTPYIRVLTLSSPNRLVVDVAA